MMLVIIVLKVMNLVIVRNECRKEKFFFIEKVVNVRLLISNRVVIVVVLMFDGLIYVVIVNRGVKIRDFVNI